MPLIDADVHNAFADIRGELRPFLPRLWQEFADRHGIAVPPAGLCFAGRRAARGRPAAFGRPGRERPGPPDQGPPRPLRRRFRHPDGIPRPRRIHPLRSGLGDGPGPAYNMNLVGRWLGHSPRFRGSIIINHSDPAAAALEIERCAGDKRFVQVLMGAGLEPAVRPAFLPPHLRGGGGPRAAGRDPSGNRGRRNRRHPHPGRAADALF